MWEGIHDANVENNGIYGCEVFGLFLGVDEGRRDGDEFFKRIAVP